MTKHPIPIEWLAEPMDEDDLPGYLADELQAFNKIYDVHINEWGYVTGNFSPVDVLTLGYKLLAWTRMTHGE